MESSSEELEWSCPRGSVTRISSGGPHWSARYRRNGVIVSKSYYIKKYGEIEAKRLAKYARDSKL